MDIWKEEAEKRKRQAEEAKAEKAVEREFAGMPCRVIPLDMGLWVKAGLIPDYLAAVFYGNETKQRKDKPLTEAEYQAALRLQKDMLCQSLDSPRLITEGEPKDGEFLYTDFVLTFPDVAEAILDWQKAGCPDAEISMGGQAAKVSDLKSAATKRKRDHKRRGDGAHIGAQAV